MTTKEALQSVLDQWIGVDEATLLLSIRSANPDENVYVPRQDIDQLRALGRLPDGTIHRVTKHVMLYSREIMRTYPVVNKIPHHPRGRNRINAQPVYGLYKRQWGPETFPVAVVLRWIQRYPVTIADLKKQGYTIPREEEALQLMRDTAH